MNRNRLEFDSRNRAIAKAVLAGERVSQVARHWRISHLRCGQIVRSVCRGVDRELYVSIEPNRRYAIPIAVLVQYADAFVEAMEDDTEPARYTPLWRVQELPRRLANALLHEGIATVGDLEGWTREDLLRIPNIGEKSASLILDVFRSSEL